MKSHYFYNHQALVKTLPDFKDESLFSIPTLQQSINGHLVEYLLVSNAKVMLKIAQQNDDKIALRSTLGIYKLIDSIYNIKKKYSNDESAILSHPHLQEDYGNALNTLHYIYEQDPSSFYLQEAFMYMERVKGNILLKNLAEMRQSELFGVPDSLVVKSQLNAKAINSYLLKHPDQLIKNHQEQLNSNDTLFQLLQQKDEQESFFKEHYPQYHQVRYQTAPITLEELKKQLNGHALVEYFWTNQYLYALYIDAANTRFLKIELDAIFQQRIKSHIELLKGNSNSKEDFLLYQQNAYDLYVELLAPLFADKIPDRLVIIPDGPLASIPFETLTTAASQFESVN